MKDALTVFLLGFSVIARADDLPRAAVLAPVVEVEEEDIYTYTNVQNGAGPMWCSRSTALVCVGGRLFASGLETVPDARQLLRSGTSVGANVEEAQAGQSRADFVSKYAIALKEAREANYWLRLLIESGDCPLESGTPLCREAEALKRIIASIIVKAKKSTPRK